MQKTNFDKYLEEQLKDPVFAACFERAGEAWDVAHQIAALRNEAGLSQKDLAKILERQKSLLNRRIRRTRRRETWIHEYAE